ncbi:MAG: RNA polymerase factor sigma-54 [Thermoguttaceae bacterium]
MRLSFGQELRQEQRQILSQRMIQSMEILQLSLQQLEERIDLEMENNPVLELKQDEKNREIEDDSFTTDNFDGNSDADFDAESNPSYEREPEMVIEPSFSGEEEFQIADDFAKNYADTIDELPARSQNWIENDENRRHDAFANIASPSQTLQEYLVEQLGWFDLGASLREMTERIIYNIDRRGYFPYSIDDFFGSEQTAEDEKNFKEGLALVRTLDPIGVGARDLKDCLLLQLRPEMPNFDLLRQLIQSHLENIQYNRIPQIVQQTGYEMSEVQEAIETLRHLNPKPGSGFSEEGAATIIPDVIVEKNEWGEYKVRLEERQSGQLQVSDSYREMMKNKETDRETRNYLKQNIGSAQWLIEAIAQRRATLLKVSQAIVDHQIDFFEEGPQSIKPLKMQQIAELVGVHVTTVSRACDDKWMLTSQGVYPLKRFFSGSIAASDGGENLSQDTVRQRLREIIDNEDKNEPLSDDSLVEKLEEIGIKVARRTVVKYRQLLNIPSSRVRKLWTNS